MGRIRASALALGVGLMVASMFVPGTATGREEAAAQAPPAIQSWELTATGSPGAVYVADPAIPIPAEPAIEFTYGFSSIRHDSGPSARALASAAWPGPVAGDGLTALDPSIPAYGVRAEQNYPADDGDPPAEFGPPEATPYMYASAAADQARAISRTGNSRIGDLEAQVFSVGSANSESFVEVVGTDLVRSIVVTTVSDLNFAGVFTIDSIRAEAETLSDGVTGTPRTSVTFSGVEAGGFPAEIGPDGITLIDDGTPIDEILAPLGDAVDTLDDTLPDDLLGDLAGELFPDSEDPVDDLLTGEIAGLSTGGSTPTPYSTRTAAAQTDDRAVVRQVLDIAQGQLNTLLGEVGFRVFTAPPSTSSDGPFASAATGGLIIVVDTFRGAQIRDGVPLDTTGLILSIPAGPSFHPQQPNLQGALLAGAALGPEVTYLFGGGSSTAAGRPPFEFDFSIPPAPFQAPAPQQVTPPEPSGLGSAPGPTTGSGGGSAGPATGAPVTAEPAGSTSGNLAGIAIGAGLVIMALLGSGWFGALMRQLPTDIFAGPAASSCPGYREGYDWSGVESETSKGRSILHPF